MLIDVNANLSRWPFRRTPCDELPRLVETYRKHGVTQAWLGSLDGLFHRDMAGVNLRLADACRQERGVELVPFGSINPMLPDWQEDLRRCVEQHHMPGIRLHPNYHGYRLDEPVFAQVLDLAAKRGLIVQLAIRMDDPRVQHPLMRVPDVDAKPLAELAKARPGLRLVLLNALATISGALLAQLAATGRIWFEIAMKEGVAGVAQLVNAVSPQRVLFGSHLPLFPLESAVLKMQEAGLDGPRRQAIEHQNAQRLLQPAAR
ncbi:MAG: amidohydrolase family protein [Thermoguttaceae bacterium]|jgi:predicted TIM-barrel fold metal-dependent hydrolase|nr:amidohydrolase family protein [Thermoguttaceae bacterium]